MSGRIRSEAPRVGRFLLLGAVNSAASIVLYALLRTVLPVTAAYLIAYLAGIGSSALLSPRLVFGAEQGSHRLRAFGGYLLVFAAGLAVVWVLDDAAGWSAAGAGIGSVAVTAPLNYLVGRVLWGARPPPDPD